MPNVPFIANDRNFANIPNLDNRAPGPDAFGAGLGQGIQSAAGSAADAFAAVQARRADAEATQAWMEYSSKVGKYLNGDMDPQTGAVIPGALAKNGYDARGVAQGFGKANQEWVGEYKGKLSADALRLFQQRADAMSINTMERLTDHEAREMRNGDVGTFAGAAAAANIEAQRNWTDTNAFNGILASGETSLSKALRLKGASTAEIAVEVDKYRNKAVADRVQTAIANKRYDDALALVADKRLMPEQQGELAGIVERAKEQQMRLEQSQAAYKESQLTKSEAAKLSKLERETNWRDPAQRAKYFEIAGASPSPVAAEEYWNKGKQMESAVQRSEDASQKAANVIARNSLMSELDTGLKLGPRGEIIKVSVEERGAAILDAVRRGDITFAQGEKLQESAKKYGTQKIQDLNAQIFSRVIPEAKKYFAMKDNGTEWALDENGRQVVGRDAKNVPFDPKTPLFSRRYDTGQKQLGGMLVTSDRDIPPQFRSAVGPVSADEQVTIDNVQEALNIVNDQMLVDSSITVEKGVALFSEMIRPEKERIAKGNIASRFQEQQKIVDDMRLAWQQKALFKNVPAAVQNNVTLDSLRSSAFQRAFGNNRPHIP